MRDPGEQPRPQGGRGVPIDAPRGRNHTAEIALGSLGSDVTIVEVNPSDLAGSLVAGKVDAVMAWEPITHDIITKVGNNAISWPAQGGQDLFWLLVSREEVVKNRGEALEKLMRALSQAANFAREKPEEVREIISRWIKVPVANLQAGKFRLRYRLFLDQALVLAMEDQARWMVRHKLTSQTRLPNYLDYFHAETLANINPKGVRLVIPGKEASQ
jgi:NitT/TauT family transport system substrate-binding protein